MGTIPIDTLVTRVLAELERLHHSALSKTRYRQFYQRVLDYAQKHRLADYSEDVGRQFFEACYAFDWGWTYLIPFRRRCMSHCADSQ